MTLVVVAAMSTVDRWSCWRLTAPPAGDVERGKTGTQDASPALVVFPFDALSLPALTRAYGLPPVPANWTWAHFAGLVHGATGGAVLHSLGVHRGLYELTMSSLLYTPATQALAVVVLNAQQAGDVSTTAALGGTMVYHYGVGVKGLAFRYPLHGA